MRHKSIPYECPRCSYTTSIKTHMQKHLYRKNICPSEKCDLELTEDIKQTVLLRRVYHVVKEPTSKFTFNNNQAPKKEQNSKTCAYLYLIQEREQVEAHRCVYKIGRTCQSPGTVIKRFAKYKKDTKILCVSLLNVDIVETAEKYLKDECRRRFEKHYDGHEHFIAPCDDTIMDCFYDVISLMRKRKATDNPIETYSQIEFDNNEN